MLEKLITKRASGDIDAYRQRFDEATKNTLYYNLEKQDRDFIRLLAFRYRMTFQELRQLTVAVRDLDMWGEPPLREWWVEQEAELSIDGRRRRKKELFLRLWSYLDKLKKNKRYSAKGVTPPRRKPYRVEVKSTERNLLGMCPVYSDDTVCCGLRTLDAVTRCGMGCSYCTIQTFYGENVIIEKDLAARLQEIELDPERFYHIGTGQASDSLLWGNREGLLDALFEFARAHPNVLLELKTKSDNVGYLLEQPVPPNVLCSWSLNTPKVIANEEHFTAKLDKRLAAAEKVAAQGIPVAFHFHPMIYYEGWEEDYSAVAGYVLDKFLPQQVWFVSFGTVTLIKPVLKEIRRRGGRTRITQMDMVPDPKGKLTYPVEVKALMYKKIYQLFEPWHRDVFFYLCMEAREVWEAGLGFCFEDTSDFEKRFSDYLRSRLALNSSYLG